MGDERGRNRATACEGGLNSLDAVDDVEVCDHVAPRVNHHPGAHAIDAAEFAAAVFTRGYKLLAVNVDDGIPLTLDRNHDRRSPGFRRDPSQRRCGEQGHRDRQEGSKIRHRHPPPTQACDGHERPQLDPHPRLREDRLAAAVG